MIRLTKNSAKDYFKFLPTHKNECLGILPIWPCYAIKIFSGIKKFEFRKKSPRTSSGCFLIYETAPVSAISGYFIFDSIYVDTPEAIWNKCSLFSGIEKTKYDSYFIHYNIAVALCISKAAIFQDKIIIDNCTPQSYIYL